MSLYARLWSCCTGVHTAEAAYAECVFLELCCGGIEFAVTQHEFHHTLCDILAATYWSAIQ